MIAAVGFRNERAFGYVARAVDEDKAGQVIALEALLDCTGGVTRLTGDGTLVVEAGEARRELPRGTPTFHRTFRRIEEDAGAQYRLDQFLDCFLGWCERSSPVDLIVNRPDAGLSNSSKPAHAILLGRFGFDVPPLVVSTGRDALLRFAGSRRAVLSKGSSGQRTVGRRAGRDEIAETSEFHDPPTLLQSFIEGDDVRVHCIGLDQIALRIRSSADDYRYAHEAGGEVTMELTQLPPEIAMRCWSWMRAERLELAAFDFKVSPEGSWWLLEVNPMPAFSWFDADCGGAVLRALLGALRRGYSNYFDPRLATPFVGVERRPGVDTGAAAAAVDPSS